MLLDFDPNFPVKVTSGGYNLHPAMVETSRGLVAAVFVRDQKLFRSFSLDRGKTWASTSQFGSQAPVHEVRAHYNHEGGFAIVWGNPDATRDIWFEEINEIMSVSEDLRTVRIDRSNDSASKGMSMEISNPQRLYDPEVPNTRWTGVWLPGAKVVVWLGYGPNVVKRFSGFIDDVEIDDQSGFLSVTGRGEMKQILDQHLKKPRRYADVSRVKNIADFAIEAGMDADKVIIQGSPELFTEDFERERTFLDVIGGHATALNYSIREPDEGGMVVAAEATSFAPSWYYEEELNMFSRVRSWDDDEVYTSVIAYRDVVFAEDGRTVEVAAVEFEAFVSTPFQTPPRKTEFLQVPRSATQAQTEAIAKNRALQIGRIGRDIQIVAPLNVALEVGDTISIRRKSWNQSGLFLVETLGDDCKKNMGQSRGLAGTSSGGQFGGGQGGGGGFTNVISCRRVD